MPAIKKYLWQSLYVISFIFAALAAVAHETNSCYSSLASVFIYLVTGGVISIIASYLALKQKTKVGFSVRLMGGFLVAIGISVVCVIIFISSMPGGLLGCY